MLIRFACFLPAVPKGGVPTAAQRQGCRRGDNYVFCLFSPHVKPCAKIPIKKGVRYLYPADYFAIDRSWLHCRRQVHWSHVAARSNVRNVFAGVLQYQLHHPNRWYVEGKMRHVLQQHR